MYRRFGNDNRTRQRQSLPSPNVPPTEFNTPSTQWFQIDRCECKDQKNQSTNDEHIVHYCGTSSQYDFTSDDGLLTMSSLSSCSACISTYFRMEQQRTMCVLATGTQNMQQGLWWVLTFTVTTRYPRRKVLQQATEQHSHVRTGFVIQLGNQIEQNCPAYLGPLVDVSANSTRPIVSSSPIAAVHQCDGGHRRASFLMDKSPRE